MPNVKTYSKKKQGNKLVSKFCPNFKIKEFACHDGSDTIKVDKDMVFVLQKFREYIKKPAPINSAYRTPSYNRAIGGATASYHIYGRAFDMNGVISLDKMTAFFNTLGVGGIIKYKDSNFVHVDSRENPYHADSNGNLKKYDKVTLKFPGRLNRTSTGVDVGIVQFKLKRLGYFNGKVDGHYTAATKTAVSKFQKAKKLKTDKYKGHVDEETWKKLFS